jgi:hypothetical protein
MVKQDIDKLLPIGFIESVEEDTQLSPIIVVAKKNGKPRICISFKKLNATTKKDPYPLPFIDEMLNTIAGYAGYSLVNGYLGYHQISITPEDKYNIIFVIDWGAFIWKVMLFGV